MSDLTGTVSTPDPESPEQVALLAGAMDVLKLALESILSSGFDAVASPPGDPAAALINVVTVAQVALAATAQPSVENPLFPADTYGASLSPAGEVRGRTRRYRYALTAIIEKAQTASNRSAAMMIFDLEACADMARAALEPSRVNQPGVPGV